MKDDRFEYLCILTNRIESEVYRASQDILRLGDYEFRTIPERDLANAVKHMRQAADYIEKNLAQIEAARARAA